MPFISKDWRSPGELWVKTDEGWERKKVLENCKTFEKNCIEATTSANFSTQPHCYITIKHTKEIAGFNELTEAVKRLDFLSAVKDVRRFNYICALLGLLIGQQMTALSGCVQKVLLQMLEEVAIEVSSSHHNPRNFRQLVKKLRSLSVAERSACWGGLLGSQILWAQHTAKIERILNMAGNMQICKLNPESKPQLLQLPQECIREIILRLSDHRDLIASAQTCDEMSSIVEEQRIWRELTKFHFSSDQIDLAISPKCGQVDWQATYKSLKKSFGIREDRQYAEMLSLCRYCKCLFWKSLGHPCIAEQSPEFRARVQEAGGVTPPSPIPPSAFLKFFSL